MFKQDCNLKRLKKAQKAREKLNKEREGDKRNSRLIVVEEAPPLIRYTPKQIWQRKSRGG